MIQMEAVFGPEHVLKQLILCVLRIVIMTNVPSTALCLNGQIGLDVLENVMALLTETDLELLMRKNNMEAHVMSHWKKRNLVTTGLYCQGSGLQIGLSGQAAVKLVAMEYSPGPEFPKTILS